MNVVVPLLIGIVSGALSALYGPYLSEAIKSYRQKTALRLAIYRELVYMYRLVSDMVESTGNPGQLDQMSAQEKAEMLSQASFFISWGRAFLYQRDLYQFIRTDFERLELFYRLDEAFVVEKTYIDFYRTFEPELCSPEPQEQLLWLAMYRLRFEANVRSGALSAALLRDASKNLHYGRETVERLLSKA